MQKDQLIGQKIDNFIVEERIGEGGMARVYRAHQPAMNRDVALKIIDLGDEIVARQNFQERFANEAELIASLEHIHILPVYDYGIKDNIAYLAMRLLRGGTLSDLIHDEPLPTGRAITIFGQVARGLAYAHSKGIIHRDLKPGNIMLDDAGNALLTDFGLAKIITGTATIDPLTRSGHMVGTPAYMSPEQLRGDPVDHRSDIYNMGIILYQMLTGRLPFDSPGSDIYPIMYKHLNEPPDRLRQHNPEISTAVEAVVLRALEKHPNDRWDSMGDMANDLYKAAGMHPGSTPFPLPQVPRVPYARRRLINPLIAGAGVMAMIVALVLFLLVGLGRGGEEFPSATILMGETGTLEDTTPTEAEIATAKRRVGDGFIGFITCNRTSEYHAGYARELVDFFNDYGLHLRIYDSDSDQRRQIPLIEQARSDGAVGLVICPLDISLLASSLRSIESAGILLILTHASDYHYGGVAMGGDDYLLGLKPGRFAGQLIRDEMGGKADVIILDYPDLPNIVHRADGLEDGLLEFAPEANIIGRYLGAVAESARESVEKLLAEGITFDVILSINDAGSFGAIEALEDAGYGPDDVAIISVDAEALAKQYISEGYFMRGSVALDRSQQTQAVANSMVKLLAGGTIPEVILTEPGDMVTRESLEGEPE